MAQLTGLCMKCRDENNKPVKDREMTNVTVETKEGKGGTPRYMARGTCGVCGGGMVKFLSKDDAAAFM